MVQTIIIGQSKVIQYTTPEGRESFINESNIKNLKEFKFLIDAAKHGLDDTKTKKMAELGRESDRLDIEIREAEQELKETLDRMRRGK